MARGRGHLRLKNGKAWTLLTTMTELKGHEEHKGDRRAKGAEHGVHPGRKTWLEQRAGRDRRRWGTRVQPYVVIVGGGQGGIALGARLRRLGVSAIIVEKNDKPGDSWRKRYKSLCLHDPVWYDHLPYLPFPDDWPVFAPKDKIGDWLEMYTKVMELNYWGSTTAKKARYDEAAKQWEVVVERDGKEITLRPRELVFALGVSGYPNVPQIPGADIVPGRAAPFEPAPRARGLQGQEVRGAGRPTTRPTTSARRCGSTAPTSPWCSAARRTSPRRTRSMELALGGLYSEQAVKAGVTTNMADLIFASIPYKIMAPMQVPVYDEMKKRDADLYARLEKAGFMLDFGVDGSGLFMKYLRRGSGYYIDVGASELVANGSIKLKSGVTIERINPNSVTLSDGSELPADLIVYATGYGSMNGWLADLICARGRRPRRQGAGGWARTRPRIRAPGKANCATCGSRRRCRTCGSTAATCTSRGTIRSSWHCN